MSTHNIVLMESWRKLSHEMIIIIKYCFLIPLEEFTDMYMYSALDKILGY